MMCVRVCVCVHRGYRVEGVMMGAQGQFRKQWSSFFFKPPFLFLAIPVHGVIRLLFYQEQISLVLHFCSFSVFLCLLHFSLFFFFICQSGMLARPSSVGGGPHIPCSRSAGGKGDGEKREGVGGSGLQNICTHTPQTIPQESSQKPAAALSEVTIHHIVIAYAYPRGRLFQKTHPLKK